MRIDREELYRRVWETPVSRLAMEFDISDVGLAKACRKHAIPLPPVGYWTKLRHGKVVPKPKLPERDPVDIELNAHRFRSAALPKMRSDVPPISVDVRPTLPPEQLSPFTAATRKRLLQTKPDAYGFVWCAGPGLFDCRIGANATESVCQLLDAIEKALPQVDVKLVKGKERLEVEHEGQTLTFKLIERCERQELIVRDKHYKVSESKDYVYTFPGTSSLEIDGYFEGRKRWTDGKRASLGQKLGDFVQGLAAAAKALKQRAIEQEEQRRRWAEDARLREERERERRIIEDFRQKLLAEATASRESEIILAYLQRVQAQLGHSAADLEQPAKEWLDLAQRIAGHLDPTPQRVQHLISGTVPNPYSGHFGNTLL